MPVYVCAPGAGSLEPWRHGIQVYERPFDLDEAATTTTNNNNNTNPIYDWPTGVPLAEEEDAADDTTEQDVTSTNNNINITGDNEDGTGPTEIATTPLRSLHNNNTNSNRSSSQQQQRTTATAQPQRRSLLRPQPPNIPIRRIRHAELVLVDDVCIAYGRYWLRLRWPGHCNNNTNHDGSVSHNSSSLFAGYIAMGRVEEQDKDLVGTYLTDCEMGARIRSNNKFSIIVRTVSHFLLLIYSHLFFYDRIAAGGAALCLYGCRRSRR